MKQKKECIAMLLAGGQGTRLGVLTSQVAKPAVPFGGKYRIIDFTLSNTINSNIDTIGVLTQYQPFELNTYIGNGQPWDLDRLDGGVFVLPPFMKATSGEWYKGTANAIYQNIAFIDKYDPEYVLILSGDHIYKMDYSLMLDSHKKNKADCTIAVFEVPIEQASRFGIMNTDESGRICAFEEKPKKPKSNKASMGIYIFSWQKLRTYLIADEADKSSQNDFGKNIIPCMLKNGEAMYAYSFNGYWKDVGTISSLWEANMDLLDEESGINLNDTTWKIYARNSAEPPHYLGLNAVIKNSSISEGCEIDGLLKNSILSQSCTVGRDAVIENSIIMPGAVIEEDAVIKYAIVGSSARICKGARVGEDLAAPNEKGEWDIALIGPDTVIKSGSTIKKGEML
ncbi:MAG: glucose-1-phosphate adenylyltransferase [Clostridiales bacterium]|jgi:glucose-1-phosphate adenylyltransferase|nr:glucose-1-phosphate adenylyltransferase [Clostridiales bacterium]